MQTELRCNAHLHYSSLADAGHAKKSAAGFQARRTVSGRHTIADTGEDLLVDVLGFGM